MELKSAQEIGAVCCMRAARSPSCSNADMSSAQYEFVVHDERLAIARLAPLPAGAPWSVPAWARGRFVTVSRTPTELSIVCAEAHVPREVLHDRDKVALGIAGTIPMTTVGLLASLCGALAAAEVPVFAISTYDTDYLLVSASRFEAARRALIALGHRVTGALPA
jgi:hypothetical protein